MKWVRIRYYLTTAVLLLSVLEVSALAEYTTFDKDVQGKMFDCITGPGLGSSPVCGANAASSVPAVLTVANAKPIEPKAVPNNTDIIFRSIGPEDAMRMLQQRDDVIFLDVRTEKERSYGAIPGSKLVSIFDLVKGNIPMPKDKPILLVCAVGGRSYMAGQMLSKQGYQEVYNLSGGVKGWYKAGLPIIQE